ncbi:NAD-dependent epimerase/dehydratase family protein [Streptomyces sp. NPDC057717]|uniref:NAD-dependent epimerase/dehydratase family protein n=1 Tax=Streptomyces sp. NPDC057717 TaxID=3346224 RepID=UPI0036AD2A5C
MRVFITGATGYIGGSVAAVLLKAGYQVAGLTRDATKAASLQAHGISPVLGDLDDRETLIREASAADAVVNAADSNHLPAAQALIDALAGTGKTLLHTSGSSIVASNDQGTGPGRVFTEADVLPGAHWKPEPDKTHRVALDRLVLAASGRDVRSVVLCNTLIYGHGLGLHRDSVQVPILARQARSSGVARHIGPGDNVWSTVHIEDMANLYLKALQKASAGSFLFVENGEARFKDVAQAIADAYGIGTAQSWDIASAIAEWGPEYARNALGSNSRVRSTVTRTELDWQPAHTSVTDWIRKELRNDPAGDPTVR